MNKKFKIILILILIFLLSVIFILILMLNLHKKDSERLAQRALFFKEIIGDSHSVILSNEIAKKADYVHSYDEGSSYIFYMEYEELSVDVDPNGAIIYVGQYKP